MRGSSSGNSILRTAACVLLVLALGCAAFAYWGLYADSGQRTFGGMAGFFPIAAGIAGAFLALCAFVAWRHRHTPSFGGNKGTVATANFAGFLTPQRLTAIVDVGANPIDGQPPYEPMLSAGLCHVTGFEPQEQALTELQQKQGPNEKYLPYSVGDGNTHTLNICVASGMTSLLEPDPTTLSLFDELRPLAEVTRRVPLKTRKLDDIFEIQEMDFLKIDIQGGELAVFKNGKAKLSKAVVIQTEISFVTLYQGQPCLGDVDLELRRQGFIPHCFAALKQWPIAPCVVDGNPRKSLNQLLEADIVYVRDITRPELMSIEQLKQLALIVHYCYRSYDLALRCVMLLEQRQALKPGAQQWYLQHCAAI